MTELQFWQKANRAFEKPSPETYSEEGLCWFLYMTRKSLSYQVYRKIDTKISNWWLKETKRTAHLIVDRFGVVSPIRLRFINRMIRQLKNKKPNK